MPKVMKSMNNVSRAQATYRQIMSKGTPCEELQPCQHTFVLAICRAPGRSQEEIAADLCLNKSTVARAVASLEGRGYVRREENPTDKRESLIYPTDKMLTTLPAVRTVAREWNKLISDGVSDEELEVFESVLHRMEKNAKACVEGKVK